MTPRSDKKLDMDEAMHEATERGDPMSGPVPSKSVRFRFTCKHTHTHMGLPFTDGDEITIDAAWADLIESQGSGHRLTDKE